MKLIYIHQYFLFPEEGGATRSYWFVKKLLDNGYDVKVITTTHNLSNRKPGSYIIEGIEFEYLNLGYANSDSKLQKVKNFVLFALISSWKCLITKNIKFIFATSTPITVGLPALFIHFIKGTPFIFEVRDLWPEFPIQVGAIKSRIIITTLKWFEKLIYKKAKWIIALSPGMKEGIINVLPDSNSKISVIPNMSKIDIFSPRKKNTETLKKYSISSGEFICIHFGTMGYANGLDYLIDAFKLFKNNPKYKLILLGQGAMKNHINDRIKKENINNIIIIDYLDSYMTSELVNCSDISLVPFLNLKVLKTNSPNKLFDSLAAGKPVIVNCDGWTKDIVENYSCGKYADPNSPEMLREIIVEYANDQNLLRHHSDNARKLAESKFDKSIITEKFINIINENFKNN